MRVKTAVQNLCLPRLAERVITYLVDVVMVPEVGRRIRAVGGDRLNQHCMS